MKSQTFESVAENAYGKKLDTPLKYSGTYNEYEKIEEVRAANDLPSDQEIIDFRNTQRKANARQKALQAALDAAGIVKPTLENDDQLKLKKMYEIFIAAKNTHDEARAKASAALGLDWAE